MVPHLDGNTVRGQAAGGYCHTLALTKAGAVLTLGCADDGQRGDGREVDDEARPPVTEAVLPAGERAVQVAAGANHSVVLAASGTVFTFGSNEVGQCGVREGSGGLSDDEDDDDEGGEPVLRPTVVQLPEGAGRAVRVSAGYAHTVVHDDSGRIYTFGQNDNGQLALGAEGVADDVPESVPLPRQARAIP